MCKALSMKTYVLMLTITSTYALCNLRALTLKSFRACMFLRISSVFSHPFIVYAIVIDFVNPFYGSEKLKETMHGRKSIVTPPQCRIEAHERQLPLLVLSK